VLPVRWPVGRIALLAACGGPAPSTADPDRTDRTVRSVDPRGARAACDRLLARTALPEDVRADALAARATRLRRASEFELARERQGDQGRARADLERALALDPGMTIARDALLRLRAADLEGG